VAVERGICFHRGPVLGNMGGGSFPGAFEIREKFPFYQKKFYWGIQETCQRRLWKRATVSIGATVGVRGGGSFTGTY